MSLRLILAEVGLVAAKSLRWDSLPRDMQVLLEDFLVCRERIPMGSLARLRGLEVPVRMEPLRKHMSWARSLDWDDRGPEQVARMAEEMERSGLRDFSPVVIHEGEMLDGRHRALAAEKAGLRTLPSIHLEELAGLLRVS